MVGGALRDELLGREIARRRRGLRRSRAGRARLLAPSGGAVVPLSERHGAWRVAFRAGKTVDFTPLHGRRSRTTSPARDFTVNAIARRSGRRADRPASAARPTSAEKRLRAVGSGVFEDDPLRLLRAVRLEDELGAPARRRDRGARPVCDSRVGEPAGERILAELERLSPDGFRRADELGLLEPLGGSLSGLDRSTRRTRPASCWWSCLGEGCEGLPRSRTTCLGSPRTLLAAERPGRRVTPRDPPFPTAHGALGRVSARLPRRDRPLRRSSCRPRRRPSRAAASRGGRPRPRLEAGPEIGRLLELVAEERAAGTISTRDEALALVRAELGA